MRTTFPVVVWVLLRQGNQVLLIRRANTGFEDGNYAPVGGHLEGKETVKAAAIREAQEEIGVQIDEKSLHPLGVVHYLTEEGEGVDFFFQATSWSGTPTPCAECDHLSWYALEALPENTVSFIRRAIAIHVLAGIWFDEDQVQTASHS